MELTTMMRMTTTTMTTMMMLVKFTQAIAIISALSRPRTGALILVLTPAPTPTPVPDPARTLSHGRARPRCPWRAVARSACTWRRSHSTTPSPSSHRARRAEPAAAVAAAIAGKSRLNHRRRSSSSTRRPLITALAPWANSLATVNRTCSRRSSRNINHRCTCAHRATPARCTTININISSHHTSIRVSASSSTLLENSHLENNKCTIMRKRPCAEPQMRSDS
jgi:hypothetical protein